MTAEYIATEKPDHTFNLISQPLKTTQQIDLEFANKRAKYIRYRLYAIAAKVIKTGRKVIIKCQAQYYQLLTKVSPLIRIL
jgi:hypothetical protein